MLRVEDLSYELRDFVMNSGAGSHFNSEACDNGGNGSTCDFFLPHFYCFLHAEFLANSKPLTFDTKNCLHNPLSQR